MKQLESYPMHRRDFLTLGAGGLASLLASAMAPASAAQADQKKLPGKTSGMARARLKDSGVQYELNWSGGKAGNK